VAPYFWNATRPLTIALQGEAEKLADLSRKLRYLVPDFAVKSLVRSWRVFGRATSSLRMLPDWLIIGAQRSGTSSLYEHLVNHPLVGRSIVEEVHYFDRYYARGIDWYRGNFPTRLRMRIATRGRAGRARTGEATPNYMAHPHAPRRIAETLPDVRLIVLLRNPVDRAYSHFHHERDMRQETLPTFEEAVRAEGARMRGEMDKMMADERYYSFAQHHFTYVARGRYASQLERIFTLFSRERVLVLNSEHLLMHPASVYAQALRFLDLPDHRLRDFPRSSVLLYPPMAPEIRARLQAVFEMDNERLFKLLGVDFGWNTVTPMG
jgi:hypothetical protein